MWLLNAVGNRKHDQAIELLKPGGKLIVVGNS